MAFWILLAAFGALLVCFLAEARRANRWYYYARGWRESARDAWALCDELMGARGRHVHLRHLPDEASGARLSDLMEEHDGRRLPRVRASDGDT